MRLRIRLIVRYAVLGLLVSLTLLAVACSDEEPVSDDDSTPSSTIRAAGSSRTVSPSPITTPTPTPEPTQPPTPTRTPEPTQEPTPEPTPYVPPVTDPPAQSCHPSYQGACLNPSASDYDCAGGSGNGPYYTGPVTVVGPDVFDLDRDGDGYGCE
jgi:hypothetical protein